MLSSRGLSQHSNSNDTLVNEIEIFRKIFMVHGFILLLYRSLYIKYTIIVTRCCNCSRGHLLVLRKRKSLINNTSSITLLLCHILHSINQALPINKIDYRFQSIDNQSLMDGTNFN